MSQSLPSSLSIYELAIRDLSRLEKDLQPISQALKTLQARYASCREPQPQSLASLSAPPTSATAGTTTAATPILSREAAIESLQKVRARALDLLVRYQTTSAVGILCRYEESKREAQQFDDTVRMSVEHNGASRELPIRGGSRSRTGATSGGKRPRTVETTSAPPPPLSLQQLDQLHTMFQATASYKEQCLLLAPVQLWQLRIDVVEHLLCTATTRREWDRAVAVADRFQIPRFYLDLSQPPPTSTAAAAHERVTTPSQEPLRELSSEQALGAAIDARLLSDDAVSPVLTYIETWVQPYLCSPRVAQVVAHGMRTALQLHEESMNPNAAATATHSPLSSHAASMIAEEVSPSIHRMFAHGRALVERLQSELTALSILHRMFLRCSDEEKEAADAEKKAESEGKLEDHKRNGKAPPRKSNAAEVAMAEIAEQLLPFARKTAGGGANAALVQSMIRCVGGGSHLADALRHFARERNRGNAACVAQQPSTSSPSPATASDGQQHQQAHRSVDPKRPTATAVEEEDHLHLQRLERLLSPATAQSHVSLLHQLHDLITAWVMPYMEGAVTHRGLYDDDKATTGVMVSSPPLAESRSCVHAEGEPVRLDVGGGYHQQQRPSASSAITSGSVAKGVGISPLLLKVAAASVYLRDDIMDDLCFSDCQLFGKFSGSRSLLLRGEEDEGLALSSSSSSAAAAGPRERSIAQRFAQIFNKKSSRSEEEKKSNNNNNNNNHSTSSSDKNNHSDVDEPIGIAAPAQQTSASVGSSVVASLLQHLVRLQWTSTARRQCAANPAALPFSDPATAIPGTADDPTAATAAEGGDHGGEPFETRPATANSSRAVVSPSFLQKHGKPSSTPSPEQQAQDERSRMVSAMKCRLSEEECFQQYGFLIQRPSQLKCPVTGVVMTNNDAAEQHDENEGGSKGHSAAVAPMVLSNGTVLSRQAIVLLQQQHLHDDGDRNNNNNNRHVKGSGGVMCPRTHKIVQEWRPLFIL